MSEPVISHLKDHLEIERLAYVYGRAVDARDADGLKLFDTCMVPDVEVEYEFGTWTGVERQKEVTAENMWRVFTFTHHVITNPLIEVDGDSATASYRCTAAHGLKAVGGKKVIYGGSTYIQECIRTADGWRIRKHSCVNSWVDDDGSLMSQMTGEV